MSSPSTVSAGFVLQPVANGAALQIDLRDRHLNYDVSDDLKGRVRREVEDRLAEGHRAFLLNLESVELIDSCGVGVLIALHHQVSAAGGALGVIGACPFVVKVLRMMRLDRFLSLHDSQQRALKAVADPV